MEYLVGLTKTAIKKKYFKSIKITKKYLYFEKNIDGNTIYKNIC